MKKIIKTIFVSCDFIFALRGNEINQVPTRKGKLFGQDEQAKMNHNISFNIIGSWGVELPY